MNNVGNLVFWCIVSFVIGIAVMDVYHFNPETDKKAVTWTADYIHNTQLADSINKYAQQGYEIELLTVDTITDEGLEIMRMAMRKDIRALPYVETVEQ